MPKRKPYFNRTLVKVWTDAVRLATHDHPPDGKKMVMAIAQRLARAALDGNMGAISEIGNRLDGRPRQTRETEVTMTADTALLEILKRMGGKTREAVAEELAENAQ